MEVREQSKIGREAVMQMEALRTIEGWKRGALALSAVGAAAAYGGFGGTQPLLPLGILGIVLGVLGLTAALVLNLGLRNGRRNVRQMLKLLGQERTGN